MYVSILPKLCVSKVIGRIKEKSALMIFDRHPEYREKYIGEQYERDRMESDSGNRKSY